MQVGFLSRPDRLQVRSSIFDLDLGKKLIDDDGFGVFDLVHRGALVH